MCCQCRTLRPAFHINSAFTAGAKTISKPAHFGYLANRRYNLKVAKDRPVSGPGCIRPRVNRRNYERQPRHPPQPQWGVGASVRYRTGIRSAGRAWPAGISGIDSDVTSLDAQQDILPGVGGTVILVREEDAAKAKSVIEEYRRRQAPMKPRKSISVDFRQRKTSCHGVAVQIET